MNTIRIVNTVTGEVKVVQGNMMVAPNGMVFIKYNKNVVWCSASTDFEAYVID